METVKCTMCDKEIDRLDAFSKGECIECHEKNFVLCTEEELILMWGGKV